MYNVLESYPPFYNEFVELVKIPFQENKIRSSHAHEIVSAYFGYKSKSAATSAKIHQQIGIFSDADNNLTSYAKFNLQPNAALASARINKLIPALNDQYLDEILNRLDYMYGLESNVVSGFCCRMARQLKNRYSKEHQCFIGSALLIEEDRDICTKITLLDSYTPHSYISLPYFEFEVLTVSKPLTAGDKLHEINIDIIVNVLHFLNPEAINNIKAG